LATGAYVTGNLFATSSDGIQWNTLYYNLPLN